MHDAHTGPQQHLSVELTAEIAAQMAVRTKDDFLFRRDLAQDRLCAAAGHDDVGQRLHFGRAVDIGQCDMVRMRFSKRAEFTGRARIFQRAARGHVRQNNRFLRAQNFRRFGHEFDATEGNDIGIGFRRALTQFKAVTNEIREILNFGLLLIMREDDGITVFFQPVDLCEQINTLQVFTWGWSVHAFIPLPCRTRFGR